MKFTARKASVLLLLTMVLMAMASKSIAAPQPVLPNPVLYLMGTQPFTSNGQNFVRYVFDVDNRDAYPADMFAAAPALPPCGANKKASRTWVDIFDQSGKRLYGFSALGKPADLTGIWFALAEDAVPPSYVYIELNDRQTNTKYKSNLADTVP